MPIIKEHQPGSPCWFELATSDQAAAKEFYTQLLGWSINDSPMGKDEVYTIFRLGDLDVAAAFTLQPDMVQQGVPPHWGVYFSTANIEESAAKVTELGGSIILQPFDVMDSGRMAICRDPGNAVFQLWQANKNKGVGVFNEDNAVCWAELASWDTGKARDFYSGLFGWQTKSSAGMATYIEWSVAGRPSGGLLPMDEHWGKTPSHWAIYFRVADCDATVAKAQALGGSVRMPPFDAPGVGRLAGMVDPQGAGFYLITLKMAA